MTELLKTDPVRVSARRAATRERLMAAATRVFAERGIIGASVEQICEAAGFTRGAFYSNFADKDELVLALIRQEMAVQLAAAEQAIAAMRAHPGRTPEERVSYALTEFETAGRSPRESVLTQQELKLYAAREPSLRAPYLAFVDTCQQQFHALISDAMAAADLEFTCSDGDALDLLTAAHQWMQQQALFTGEFDARILRTLLLSVSRHRTAG